VKLTAISVLAAAVFMSACADPAANKPKAQTSTPTANATTKTDAAPTATNVFADFKAKGTELAVDNAKSKIEFTGSKVTGKHDGGFKMFKGVIDLVGEKAEDSRVLFEIEMNSVFTDTDGVTKHIQTPDFFDVERFPKSSFVSTKVEPNEKLGTGNYTVTGDLEIRGTKKTITFPAKITIGPAEVEVDSEFSINRRDFGIIYAGKADDLIRDDVVLRLDLHAPRKK
jgi:polyisoprenoid-binding protein YceI